MMWPPSDVTWIYSILQGFFEGNRADMKSEGINQMI